MDDRVTQPASSPHDPDRAEYTMKESAFVLGWIIGTNESCTTSELAQILGKSPNTVWAMLRRLQRVRGTYGGFDLVDGKWQRV